MPVHKQHGADGKGRGMVRLHAFGPNVLARGKHNAHLQKPTRLILTLNFCEPDYLFTYLIYVFIFDIFRVHVHSFGIEMPDK